MENQSEMQESMLYSLVECMYEDYWQKTIEKKDMYGEKTRMNNYREKMEAQLTDEQKKLLTQYADSVEAQTKLVYHDMNVKALNVGVLIGMELQKAFLNEDQEF